MRKATVTFIDGTKETFTYHDWRIIHEIYGDWIEILAKGLRDKVSLAAFNRAAIVGVTYD